MNLPPNIALVIVDVQRAIDDPSWAIDGPRNNSGAEANIATLLSTWRRIGYPIFHVRHDGTLPTSTLAPISLAHQPRMTPSRPTSRQSLRACGRIAPPQ
jgi:nicotinamidase-related amidase